MATVEDKLSVIGGRAGESTLCNDVHIFDTAKDTWSTPAVSGTPPEVRDFLSLVTFEQYIILFGGAQEVCELMRVLVNIFCF